MHFDTVNLNGDESLTDLFMGITVYNIITTSDSPIPSLTPFFGLMSMIVVCVVIVYRGLHDEKQTLDLNIARNVREQSVSMRTIFLKDLVEDCRKVKSDAKFKQFLISHIGPLRDQLLEAHLVFYQDDLVQITTKRDSIIETLRRTGQFDQAINLTEISTDSSRPSEHSQSDKQPTLAKADKLQAELLKLNQEILQRQKIRRSCTGSAFVTFRSTEAALTFLRCHVTNHDLGQSPSQTTTAGCEQFALKGIFAPEPNDIRWKFVGTTTNTRRLYQFRNYLLFVIFFAFAVGIGFVSVLFQFFTFPRLIPPLFLRGADFTTFTSTPMNLEALSTVINVLSGILMTIASRVLPGLVIKIGEGYPTVSNRDNVTNNYWRILIVLWFVYCVMPIVALFSFRWFFIVESCSNDWQNLTRVVFTFKTLLSFCSISIVLDYLAIGVKVERLIKLRQKYQAKHQASKASGGEEIPVPSFLELFPIVLLTEDRSEPFEELLSYSINSVVFITNFTVSFFYPQCSFLSLAYFILKFYLDKFVGRVCLYLFLLISVLSRYQLVFLFKQTSRRCHLVVFLFSHCAISHLFYSDGTLLRYIFSLLSLFCALSIVCITYVFAY